MSEVQIPVALDRDGHPVHIDDAPRHRTNYYRCPECGDFVNPRKGDERSHHFAHAPGTLQEHPCSLGTQADVDRLMDEYRTSETEKAEKAKRIRLFLGTSYGSVVKLFGILPSLEWEDVEDPSELSEDLKNLAIQVEGVKTPPKGVWFHPTEPEVRLDLNPEADAYDVEIESDTSFDAITGTWQAPGISEGEIFIGTPERAKRSDPESSNEPAVKPGDWVYVVLAEEPEDLPNPVKTYNVGPWTALGFEIRDDTEKYLREYTSIEKADKKPFYADIVLPPWADPSSSAPVQGEPGSKALVAISPPEDADPEFEVVSVPRHRDKVIEVKRTGTGEPRIIRPEFPTKGSRRMVIHWAARQRMVHLHAREEREVRAAASRSTPPCGIRVRTPDGDSVVLNPLTGPHSAEVDVGEGSPSIKDLLEFLGPDGYELDFKLRSIGSNGASTEINRHAVTFEEALSEITYYADEESDGVLFDFDALGRVSVDFTATRPWMEDISDEEIRERLREMDELPKKARWPLVREIMGAPPGTPHVQFPDGIKKRVRRAFMEERRERRNNE